MTDLAALPERKLAIAVVAQAVADLKSRDAQEQAEALEFLTADYGAWKRSREDWCSLADLCPDRLRTATLSQISLIPQPRHIARFPAL